MLVICRAEVGFGAPVLLPPLVVGGSWDAAEKLMQEDMDKERSKTIWRNSDPDWDFSPDGHATGVSLYMDDASLIRVWKIYEVKNDDRQL